MKPILFLIFFSFFATVLHAQTLRKAERLFDDRNYYEALISYTTYLQNKDKGINDSIKSLIYFKMARCYQEMGAFDKAHKAFDRAFAEQHKTPDIYYYAGELFRTEGQYQLAINYYEQFLNQGGNKLLYEDAMLKCTFAARFSNPLIGVGVKLQPDLNTQGNIRALCFWNDRLLYTSTLFSFDWEKKTLEKAEGEALLLMAEIKNGLLVNPKLVKELNEEAKNIQSFSIDESTGVAYFTTKSASGQYTLYTTSVSDGKWQSASKVSLPLFNNITTEEVSVAKGGERLFFAGSSDDGFGGKDIWYADYKAGVWNTPVNLGRKINTPADESLPFVWQDSILFFTSSGMPENYGTADIYAAGIKQNGFTSAINLHKPFNSSFNDMGLAINQSGTFAVLFSDRSPDGKRKVYSSQGLPSSVNFYGTIRNKLSNDPVMNVSAKIFSGTQQIGEVVSDTLGTYNFAIQSEKGKDYFVKFSKPSYFSNTFALSDTLNNKLLTYNLQEISQMDVVMEELVLGKSYEFEQVFPPYYTTELFEKGRSELSRIADFATDNYWAKILLFSYCSLTTDITFNRLLSNARMDTVVRFLVAQGIDRNRLITKTFSAAEYESIAHKEHVYSLNFRLLKDNSDTIIPAKRAEDFSGKIAELYQKGMIQQQKVKPDRLKNIPVKVPGAKDTSASSMKDSAKSFDLEKFNRENREEYYQNNKALPVRLNIPTQTTFYFVELYPSQQRQGNKRLLQKIASETPDIKIDFETWDDGYTHFFIGKFKNIEEAQQLVERMKEHEIYSFIRTREVENGTEELDEE